MQKKFRKNSEILFGDFRFFHLKNGEKSTNVRFRALEGSKSPENGRNEIWPFSNFPGENMGFSDFWPIFGHFSVKVDFLKRKIEKIESRQIKFRNFFEIFFASNRADCDAFFDMFFSKKFWNFIWQLSIFSTEKFRKINKCAF